MVRGKFIAMSAYIKKITRDLKLITMLHLKLLGKQEQAKVKSSKWDEIIEVRAEINEMVTTSMKQRVGSLKRKTRLTNP
jgi:hypothetical protein